MIVSKNKIKIIIDDDDFFNVKKELNNTDIDHLIEFSNRIIVTIT